MNHAAYRAEVGHVSESDWCEWFDRFQDANIYQTWSYGSVRWGEKNLSHLVLRRDGEIVSLAQLRIIRPRNIRLGIAYLRWGPLCNLHGQMLEPDVVAAMADALYEEFVEKRGLYLQILPNAFSGSRRAEIFRAAFSRFSSQLSVAAKGYRTLLLDLSPPIEELRKNLERKWRNMLTGAAKNDLRVTEGRSLGEYDVFCKLYDQMWEQKKFTTSVRIEEFRRVQEGLPANQRMRISICEHRERPVAALVCSAIGDSAVYLLGATNEEGRKLKASYVLQWANVESLKSRGARYYDLGGIDPVANPGVYHFKSGFNGADVTHINPLVACDNGLSAALVKAGQIARSGLRSFQVRFGHA